MRGESGRIREDKNKKCTKHERVKRGMSVAGMLRRRKVTAGRGGRRRNERKSREI